MADPIRQMMASRMTEPSGRLTVRSALNPILWLCGITSVPVACITAWTGNVFWWTGFLIGGPIALAMLGFLYFMFRDPDRLQSEDFQMQARTLEYMEQKGMNGPQPVTLLHGVVTPEQIKLDAEDLQ